MQIHAKHKNDTIPCYFLKFIRFYICFRSCKFCCCSTTNCNNVTKCIIHTINTGGDGVIEIINVTTTTGGTENTEDSGVTEIIDVTNTTSGTNKTGGDLRHSTSYVPNIKFLASVYNTIMDQQLSSTPTQSLIRHASLKDCVAKTSRCLASLWEHRNKVSISKAQRSYEI